MELTEFIRQIDNVLRDAHPDVKVYAWDPDLGTLPIQGLTLENDENGELVLWISI